MKLLKRNLKTIYYETISSIEELIDDNGDYTGETAVNYGERDSIEASVSPAYGDVVIALFGTSEHYDKIVIVDDMECPITENAVLWVDRTDGPHDYIVKRVAKSINFISYAVSKVDVS